MGNGMFMSLAWEVGDVSRGRRCCRHGRTAWQDSDAIGMATIAWQDGMATIAWQDGDAIGMATIAMQDGVGGQHGRMAMLLAWEDG